jgi:hypothetical protein
MREIYTLREDDLEGALYQRIFLLIGRNWLSWQSAFAAFGLAGGMLAIIAGMLLWPSRFLPLGDFNSYLNLLGTLCFILSFPLLALGAYCLDILEKMPPVPPLRNKTRFESHGRGFRL